MCLEALKPHLPKELIYCVIDYVCCSSLDAFEVYGLEVTKYLFHEEQKQFRSLDMATGLMEIILRGTSMEALDWILGEIVQLHCAFKLPYLCIPLSLLVHSGTVDQLKHVCLNLKNEKRVGLSFSVNILYWAIQRKDIDRVKFMLSLNVPLISGDSLSLRPSNFVDAVESDSIPMVEYVMEHLCNMMDRNELFTTIATTIRREAIVKSSDMKDWLIKTFGEPCWISWWLYYCNVNCLLRSGNLSNFDYILSTPVGLTAEYLNNVTDVQQLIAKLQSRNDPDAKFCRSSTRMIISILKDSVDELNDELWKHKHYSEEALFQVFTLTVLKGNAQLFQCVLKHLCHITFYGNDSLMSLIMQLAKKIFAKGDLELAKILMDKYHVEHWITDNTLRHAIINDHHRILLLCLKKSPLTIQCHMSQKILKYALCNNAFKCLQVLKDHFEQSTAMPVWECIIKQKLSNISANVFKWLWVNGFSDIIKQIDSLDFITLDNASEKTSDMELCSFLIRTLGADRFNFMLRQQADDTHSTSVDLVEHKMRYFGDSFKYLPKDPFEQKIHYRSCCYHGVSINFIQWFGSHGFVNSIGRSNLKSIIQECNKRGEHCALQLMLAVSFADRCASNSCGVALDPV